MKKRFSSFLAGLMTAAILFGVGTAALAATGAVEFNTVGLMVNGTQLARSGEDYALDNGQKVPSTIIYTDESGGGTTYLPARRISELLGADIGYDAPSNCVTVDKEGVSVPAPTPAATPVPTPAATPVPTPAPTPEQQVSTTVYITRTGEKYHRAGCRYLSKSQIAISLTDAKAQGYSACSVCTPPR